MSKELEIVKGLIKEQKKQLKNCNWGDSLEMFTCEENINKLEIVKSALDRKEKLEMAIRDLLANHIEFVVEKDKCYFKIKRSKGKEKSFTSKTFEDFWKEVLR